jgi:cytochrome c-type biogenesis protein CcmH
MTPIVYTAGAVFTLMALALIVVPLLRYRTDSAVGLTLPAIVLLFPLTVAGTYAAVTTYPWGGEVPARAAPTAAKQPPVDEMITELAARLEREPDVEGYVLLGRSYISLQRYADASDAWHKAWELTEGRDPDISLGYAEALILADRRTLETGAADLLDSVLVERPTDARALWYGGLSAAARGLNDLAVTRFSKLLEAEIPDDMRIVVQEQLAALGAQAPATAAQAAAEEGAGMSVSVELDIDPAIGNRVSPDGMLFVFARDARAPGPPIAVKRLRTGSFPRTIKLSNADAMVAGRKLEDAQQLKIVARISLSGSAIEAPGDIYGEAFPGGGSGEQTVSVMIDRIVE